MTTAPPSAHGATDRSTALLSRRRFLQAAALIGGAGVLSATVWNEVCAAEPRFAEQFERFARATESIPGSPDLAIWTPTGSVERGQTLTMRTVSASPLLDISIHRVGESDDAIWGCEGARTRSGQQVDVAEVIADWPSGLYLISATPSDESRPATAFHPFVVTDRNSRAAITVQVPFATYQAYNAWTPASHSARSLYDYNSPDGKAAAVSLDRPYDTFDGAGFLFYGDQQLASWLQAEGIEVNYTSSWDTHHRPELYDRTRLFISNFHDEYWSAQMRGHLESRLAAGMNAAFLGANNVYWQVDLDGTTMTCDKIKGGPQGTFRSIGWPESELFGSLFESYRHPYRIAAADWVVTGTDHWAYADTGLRDGDVIERLVGYEWDRVPSDGPAADVTVLASSPIDDRFHHHATIVERDGRGTVFNAGTNYWPRMLTGGGGWERNAAVEQMTRNLISTLS